MFTILFPHLIYPLTYTGMTGSILTTLAISIERLDIIITRPKPAYGRQGLAGSWGQDTDKVSNFWVFLTSHFAQLGIKPTWDHS